MASEASSIPRSRRRPGKSAGGWRRRKRWSQKPSRRSRQPSSASRRPPTSPRRPSSNTRATTPVVASTASVADASYAKHLGIVATIRKDFEQLAEIMREPTDPAAAQRRAADLEKARKLDEERLDTLLASYENDKEELLSDKEVRRLKSSTSRMSFGSLAASCSTSTISTVVRPRRWRRSCRRFTCSCSSRCSSWWLRSMPAGIARSLETEFPHLLRELWIGRPMPARG